MDTERDADLPTATIFEGRAQTERGMHQRLAVSHSTKTSSVAVGFYADALNRIAVSGLGAGPDGNPMPSGGGLLDGSNLLVDRSNGAFQALTRGHHSSGWSVLYARSIGDRMLVAFQYCAGAGLAMQGDGVARAPATQTVAISSPSPATLQARRSQAATVSVKTSIPRTGTRLRVAYRWQPGMLVTAVDPYEVLDGGEYLGVHLRQPVRVPGRRADCVEITVDGTNVLHEGYRRVNGAGGPALFLASSPAALQAGLAFTF